VSLTAHHLSLLGRLCGRRLPVPERCDLTAPGPVLDWLAEQLRTGSEPVLWATPSAAARVSIAAVEAGRDLRGAIFAVFGEPVTEQRRRHVEACGARTLVQYSTSEASALSFGCGEPASADDVHVLLDRFAVGQRRRAAVDGGPIVDAVLVTSLAETTGKIHLNTETGDYARLEQRECGCLLGSLGLTTHLSEVRSFEKLTGEGVTFACSNLEQILEQVLPARFGGTGLDYQLAEEESADGAIRLILRVSPSVGEVDASEVRTAVLVELGRDGATGQYQAAMLQISGSIEIRREPPVPTRVGKVLPFQLLKQPTAGRAG
jgi:phenylacetate-coenzyme A ligase PaaK-like adenylate-forming protein